MGFAKATEARKASFLEALPRSAALGRRVMFGFPAAFVNGWFFAGVFEASVVLRLPESLPRDEFPELARAKPFGPMGSPMKGWVVVPAALDTAKKLPALLAKLLPHVDALPPKAKKPRKPRETKRRAT